MKLRGIRSHWKCFMQQCTWIPWNLSFRYIHCTGQFTPKIKANTVPRLLSSLVWIDSDVVLSQHRLESFVMELQVGMEFMSYRCRMPFTLSNCATSLTLAWPQTAFQGYVGLASSSSYWSFHYCFCSCNVCSCLWRETSHIFIANNDLNSAICPENFVDVDQIYKWYICTV